MVAVLLPRSIMTLISIVSVAARVTTAVPVNAQKVVVLASKVCLDPRLFVETVSEVLPLYDAMDHNRSPEVHATESVRIVQLTR